MITQAQQKTIDDLIRTYEQINSLEQPTNDLIEKISAELDKGLALKLKSETAKKIEESKSYEMMLPYLQSVIYPVLNKFFPRNPANLFDDGRLYISIGYSSWEIRPIIAETKNEDKSNSYEFKGFKMITAGRCSDLTQSLTDFNDAFMDFILKAKKCEENIYY